MRTDATLTRRQVICRNASTLGFSTYKARVGYWIVYGDPTSNTSHCGRMIARVDAPALEPSEKPVKGWLVVMTLSQDLTHCYQRWVDPDNVREIYKTRPRKFLNWFTGQWPADPKAIIRLQEYGTLSEGYVHLVKDRLRAAKQGTL